MYSPVKFGQRGELEIYAHEDGIHSDIIDWANGRIVGTIAWLPELEVHEITWGGEMAHNVNFSTIERAWRWIDGHSDVVIGGYPW